MSPEERRVAEIIAKCRGRSKAVAVRHLSYKTGLDERKIREIVKTLVEHHRLPIGSTSAVPGGYYIITDAQELRQVRRSLIRRAVSILHRAKAYDRTGWVTEMIGQLSLKLDADKEPAQSELDFKECVKNNKVIE
jgi:hypothetical protein